MRAVTRGTDALRRLKVEHTRARADWRANWLRREPFDWRALLACAIGGAALYPLTRHLPFLGHDWIVYFSVLDRVPNFYAYPPWTQAALLPLNQGTQLQGIALLNSLLLMTVAIAAAREGRWFSRRSRLAAALLAVLTPPVFQLMWQGNVAGLVLLGLVGLPLTLPYALLQPNLAAWALVSRARWLLWAAAFGLLSLLLWGWWPGTMLDTIVADAQRITHPIALGWQALGWPSLLVGLALLPFTTADPLRLLALGAFLSPYLMPAHLALLLPALGRVAGRQRWLLWGCCWLTLLPAMFLTGWSKAAALLFPLAVWWLLRRANPAA